MTEAKGGNEGIEGKVNQHIGALISSIDSNKLFASISPNVSRAEQVFNSYELKPTEGKDLESAFTKAAGAYMHGLYGIGYDDPTIPAGQIKQWLNQVSETALSEAMGSIRKGDRVKLHELFKTAYERNAQAVKTQSLVADKSNQPVEVQSAIDSKLAQLVSVNGQVVKPYEVGSNYPATVQAFAQMYNSARSLKK